MPDKRSKGLDHLSGARRIRKSTFFRHDANSQKAKETWLAEFPIEDLPRDMPEKRIPTRGKIRDTDVNEPNIGGGIAALRLQAF